MARRDDRREIAFPHVNSDSAAVNTAVADLINILDTADVPIVVLQPDITLVWFNKAANVLRFLPSDIGRSARDIPVLAGVPGLEEQCSQLIATGIESRADFHHEHKWFVVRISPYTKDDGQVSGIVLTFTNVTALLASIDQTMYERECTKAILNAVADPLVVLSADQRIHLGNRAFYEMFLELASLRMQLKEMLEGSHPFQSVEVDHVFPGEGQRTLSVDARRLSLPGHSERRVLVTFQDITARKQAETSNDLRAIATRKEELRRGAAFLAEAQRLSLTGSFSWQATTDEITWSDQLYRIYEFDIGVPLTLELIRTRVHPEDLTSYEEMIEEARNRGTDFEYEYRLRMPDQSIKHLHVVAHGIRDEDGRLEYIGAVQDVTARDRTQEALTIAFEKIKASEAQLREIVDAIPQAITVLDPEGKTLYVNQWVLDFTGFSHTDVVAPDYRRKAFHPEDVARLEGERREALSRGLPFENEQRALRKDGQYRWFLVRYNPLRDENGRILRWYATGTDIEDRKQAELRISNENLALREELDRSSMHEEIVGSSESLREVLLQINKVAPTESTVLILGETGTGKELIAGAIHKRSKRSTRAFIRVNCAAIPPSFIASELFGHEKGAFTGASQRRLGRFESADGGTIFLDEIGDLPPETQVALLRVLQERELERVGSSKPVSIDVRVIAATNRDLEAAVRAGTFRQDLFYRLNVFPIYVPSLRERKNDIPLLVEYLVERFAKRAGKKFNHIKQKTLDLLQTYDWPGNIRELQNVIERAVILSDGPTFDVDKTWVLPKSIHPSERIPSRGRTLAQDQSEFAERERKAIEAALADCNGRVSGPRGAAAKLGIPRQTLDSKIQNLCIDKRRFKARSRTRSPA